MSTERQIFRYSRSIPERAGGTCWRARHGRRFFPTTPWCLYCDEKTKIVYSNSRAVESPPEDKHEWWLDERSVYVYECDGCGWWYVEDRTDHEDNDSDDFRWSAIGYHRAVLEVHNLSNPAIPIDALAQELKKRGDGIHHIHHRAMERLVAGVMREHYPGCEVEMCGRSGDGGIDLYIVRADKTIGVQVKRRIALESLEYVSTVRDFFGAGVAKKLRDLIFVSTAKRFTGSAKGAVAFAKQVVDDNIVDSFELVNRDRFLAMLDLVVPEPIAEPWSEHIW